MSTLLFLLRHSWRLAAAAVLAGVISGLSAAWVISVVSAATSGAAPASARLAWSFVTLSALSLVSKGVSEVLLTRLGQAAIAEVRIELSRQIIAAPLRRSEELGAHRLLAALHDDAAVITQAYVSLPQVCVNGATVLGCLVVLGLSSPAALAIVVAAMLIGAWIFRAHERRATGFFARVRATSDRLFQHFRALTGGLKELKMARQRGAGFVAQVLTPSVHAYRRDFVSGMTVYSVATGFGSLLFYLVLGLVVFALPHVAGMSPQSAASATLTLLYLMAPFALLMEILPSLSRAGVALDTWRELGLSLSADSTASRSEAEASEFAASVARGESAHASGAQPVTSAAAGWQRLELVAITHRYYFEREERSFQLGPVDLSFRPGELVFLLGSNGSGKTTLALVLLGLYPPESGSILLDGMPIDDRNRARYRELFSVVFAEFHVFEQLLGLRDPETGERARHYLKRLELDHRVRVAGDTLVIDGLSQGQKKRLALLAAALDDRPFYVFDEWASDQDPKFRRVFYAELLPELRARGKAVLVITHDDQYFHLADRCLRMDFGRLSEAPGSSYPRAALAGAP